MDSFCLLRRELVLAFKRTFPGFVLYCFVLFLGLHPQHMEVPRLGVELELQLPAYTTATATRDLSLICDPHHSSEQCRILKTQDLALPV